MKQNYLCITIPEDLTCYQKVKDFLDGKSSPEVEFESDVEIIQNDIGQAECVNYYDNSELIKSVRYNGASIVEKVYYKSGRLYFKEEYRDNKVSSRYFYTSKGDVAHEIQYEYGKKDKISSIKKLKNGNVYSVKYGYDELDRVNSRKITVNSEVIAEQKYRFDILDRVAEYRDSNQRIVVKQINSANELISYTITDKMGNDISINNNFIGKKYSCTIITVNGYSTQVQDKNYVDNIMLKKPYTTEDDLDLIISQLLKPSKGTSRTGYKNVLNKTESIINENIEDSKILIEAKTLPISIRKRILFNIAQN